MIRIIPAIDIIGGKCVRLEKGDYSIKKVYSDDPLQVALMFQSWGLKYLHLVDLDGAREKKIVNFDVLRKIAGGTNLIIDFGGGIRSEQDIQIAFDNGASMITGGSIAVQNRELFLHWLEEYGSERIILGADHNNGKISTNGWNEESEKKLFPFIENFISEGITQVICTDIQKDGMLQGPSTELYSEIMLKWPGIQLIASGGISNIDDIALLDRAGIPGVIVGKAFYENRIGQNEISKYCI